MGSCRPPQAGSPCQRCQVHAVSVHADSGNLLAPEKDSRTAGVFNIFLSDYHFPNILILGNFIHDIQHVFLQNSAQRSGSCVFLQRILAMAPKAPSSNSSFTSSSASSFWYCFKMAFLGSLSICTSISSVSPLSVKIMGRTSQKFRDHSKLLQNHPQ